MKPAPSRLHPLGVLALIAAAWIVRPSAAQTPAKEAGPIDIVRSANAPRLEQLAATELAGQLEKLYGARVNIVDTIPDSKASDSQIPGKSATLIFVGSPETNPHIKSLAGDKWPKLSDQGHLIKRVKIRNGSALVVGGGSPVATLWAACELGHRLGIRYLLSGDVYPAQAPPLGSVDIDVVLEPSLRLRTWRTINDFAIGPESWGLAEHQRVLRQLAKLKFNRVMLSFYPWQPFVDFEFGGVRKQTAMLWFGYKFPLTGDTAGRAAFAGEKEFTNPDLAGKHSYEELTQAGIALARGVLDTAHDLGMSTGIAISPLEFTREFAAVLPEAKSVYGLENLTIGPGAKQPPDDPTLKRLVTTEIRAYLDAYPQLDALYLTLPEFPAWAEHYQESWKRLDGRTGVGRVASLDDLTSAARNRTLIASGDRGVTALKGNITALEFFHNLLADASLLKHADGRQVECNLVEVDPALFPFLDKLTPPNTGVLHTIDYTARRVARNLDLVQQVPAGKVRSNLILTLADDNVGVLPQMATHDLAKLLAQVRKSKWQGFSTRYWMIGDLDPAVHFIARASFDAELTPERACEDLLGSMCGEGVAERFLKALEMVESATALIDEHDIGFTFPIPDMVMKHYTADPTPTWWKEVADLYTNAMNETYRAHDRSQLPGRPLLRYFAKRHEFALEYVTCVDFLRQAGQAKGQGKTDVQLARLESAMESMYNSLSALSEVARDNSDRGAIAVLNEYGYRPLVKEFEQVQQQIENQAQEQ